MTSSWRGESQLSAEPFSMRGRQERKERRSFREPVALKVGDDDFTVSGDVDQNTDASQGTMRQLSAATIDDWTT